MAPERGFEGTGRQVWKWNDEHRVRMTFQPVLSMVGEEVECRSENRRRLEVYPFNESVHTRNGAPSNRAGNKHCTPRISFTQDT